MQMESEMDPLRPASIEDLKQLIDIYKQSLPQSVQFVSLLQNIVRTVTTLSDVDKKELSDRLRKTVYIPNNEHGNQFATFVSISPGEHPFILLHTLEAPPSELMDTLRKTSYINWDIRYIIVIGGINEIRENISQLANELKLRFKSRSDCINYWLPHNIAVTLSVSVPNDVELKPLQLQHGKQVNEWWPYRDTTSQQYFESAIKHYGGFGLFDKTSKELVACVVQNDHDAVGNLYTVPGRSNRGYGSTLAKAMTKHIAMKYKQDVHTFITDSNEVSIRLFEKVGFKAVSRTEWLQIVED